MAQAAKGRRTELEVPGPAYAHLLFVQPALVKLSASIKIIIANVYAVSQDTVRSNGHRRHMKNSSF